MRSLLAVPRTALTLLVGLVSTLVCSLTALAIATVRPTSPSVDAVIRFWARTWLWAAGCRLEVRGREHVDRNRSHVVVANHLSNFDIMVCFEAIPLPIRYLAKKELFRIPVLAPAMRAVGIVEVDRQTRGAATIDAVNRQSAAVIEHGHSLIIYPEGTRARDGSLAAFKKGAFTMAAAAGMPVLPVTIHGTYAMWRPGGKTIRSGKVTVVIDPPIETAGLDRDGIEMLRKRTHGIVERRLAELQS